MENRTHQDSDRGAVFITGATGQVGGSITRTLLAQGRAVTVLVRKPSTVQGLDNATVVTGDITDRQSLIEGMAGCSEVIHVAGAISYKAEDRDWLHNTNVVGTQNMLDAAAANNVERFLYTSSIATLGHVPIGTIGDENSTYNWQTSNNPYFDTKKEAEDRVLSERRFCCIAVNPGIIFGPGDLGHGAIQMMHNSAAGRVKTAPAGATTVISLADAVSGHLLALQHGRPQERYILGSERMTLYRLFEEIAEVVGVPPPTGTISPFLFKVSMGISNWWDKLRGITPHIGPAVTDMVSRNRQYSWEKAEKELGYTPTAFASSLTACWDGGGKTSDRRY